MDSTYFLRILVESLNPSRAFLSAEITVFSIQLLKDWISSACWELISWILLMVNWNTSNSHCSLTFLSRSTFLMCLRINSNHETISSKKRMNYLIVSLVAYIFSYKVSWMRMKILLLSRILAWRSLKNFSSFSKLMRFL